MEHVNRQSAGGTQGEEEPIDLRAYWEILLKRRWIVLLVFVAAVASTAVFTLRQPKIYSASASVVIDAQAPQVLGDVREAVELGTGAYWYNKEFYETQYRIIKSRAISQMVVGRLGLDKDTAFLGLDKLPASKQAEALGTADAIATLQAKLFVEPVKDSRVVNIRIEDTDPGRAALLANAVAQSYMQANLEHRVDGTRDAAEWLQDQLTDLKSKLTASELALHDFKQQNDLVYATLENKQTITSQKLMAISDTLTKVRTRKAELDARVKSVRAAKQAEDVQKVMELGVIASNSFINDLKKSYLTVASEVADLSERYGPEHPKMKAAEEKLRGAKRSLTAEVDAILAANLSEYDELVVTEKNLNVMLDEVKREAFENNKKEIDYRRLAREEENNQRLYELVLKRTKELDLSSLLKTNNVRILDPAKTVKIPVKPKARTNIILAAALGLLAGVGFAFLVEFQDRSIKGHQDVEALGVHFLGIVPSIAEGDPSQAAVRDLYVAKQPKSAVAECCRTIRANMQFLSPDKPAKRLVVTSAGPQEGKTTTAISLGITLANGHNRVLLVDGDMRRPRLHKSFALSNEVGLSSLIVGESSLEEAIKTTTVPGLMVLPAGPVPPNPAELLHTERFRALSEKMATMFDRVIFDSPPIGAVTDPLVMANQLDGTLFVVKMFRTNKDLAERSVNSLRDANANLLGAILNDVDLSRRHYGYYLGDYYSGYGRYYGEETRAA